VNLLIDGIDNYGFLHNFAVLTTCHHGCHAMGEARGGSPTERVFTLIELPQILLASGA